MLQVKNIFKKFNNLQVLDDFSGVVERGDFVVIMGPNGTGKSTLFDIISGRTLPDLGSVYIDGKDITPLPEQKRAHLIGRLFQNPSHGSCSHLTIRENLAMATLKQRRASFKMGIKSFPQNVVKDLLAPLQLNLERLLDAPMGALSGGQRQIIAFIMSILNPPKLLLLDEPTSALDPASAAHVLAFAKNYIEEKKIPTMMITHDSHIAKQLGNRLWILEGGKLLQT